MITPHLPNPWPGLRRELDQSSQADSGLEKLAAALHYGAMAAEAAATSEGQMHPALAQSIALALDSAAIIRRQQYVEALRAHDWDHQWAEDWSVVQRGAAERRQLRAMAAQLDANFEVWNQHSPAAHRDGGRL